MKTSDFNYNLPKELIAQEPCAKRDQCRMLVLDKNTGQVEDKHFFEIADYLKPGDLLVANETRVLPARLVGTKRDTGGEAELLLLSQLNPDDYQHTLSGTPNTDQSLQIWEALVKPGRRLKPASLAEFQNTTRSASSGSNGPIVDFADKDGKAVLSAEIID